MQHFYKYLEELLSNTSEKPETDSKKKIEMKICFSAWFEGKLIGRLWINKVQQKITNFKNAHI